MGRCMHVVVAGGQKVGKTALLNQLSFMDDITKQPYEPTIDDTYTVQTEPMSDKVQNPKELVVLHDTAGMPNEGPIELRKPYIQVADGFILVYSVCDMNSFKQVDALKRFLDLSRDKKEVPIVVLGTQTDREKREVDGEFAQSWSQKEKVKLYEVSATNRQSLIDPMVYLTSRYFHPQKESRFSLSKRLKPEKSSGAAIVMDI